MFWENEEKAIKALIVKVVLIVTISIFYRSAWGHNGEIEDILQQIAARCEKILSSEEQDKKLKNMCLNAKDPEPTEGMLQATKFYGSPVHETITKRAISIADIDPKLKKSLMLTVKRGVFWNDDPTVLLWAEPEAKEADTWGLAWLISFASAKLDSEITDEDGLLARSHFGDMQFLHSMAEMDGIDAQVTKDQIIEWAEFVLMVSVGKIAPQTQLKDIPLPFVKKLFGKDEFLFNQSVYYLFCSELCESEAFLPGIAIGTLLHIIQDSNFEGHTGRVNLFPHNDVFAKGDIYQFRSYNNQVSGLHKKADMWPSALNKDVERKLIENDPINQSAKVLELVFGDIDEPYSTKWKKLYRYLHDSVFSLNFPAKKSGPGLCFSGKSSRDCVDSNTSITNKSQVVTVSLENGPVSQNMAEIYQYLINENLINTRKYTIQNSKNIEKEFVRSDIVPLGFPKKMNSVICGLNDTACKESELNVMDGVEITIPDAQVTSYFYPQYFNPEVYENKEVALRYLSDKKRTLIEDDEYEKAKAIIESHFNEIKNEKERKNLWGDIESGFTPHGIRLQSKGFEVKLNVKQALSQRQIDELEKLSPGKIFVNKLATENKSESIDTRLNQILTCDNFNEDKVIHFLEHGVGYPKDFTINDKPYKKVVIFENDVHVKHPDLCHNCDPINIGPSCDYDRNSDHGTHVTGIISAKKNGKGMVGVISNAHPTHLPSKSVAHQLSRHGSKFKVANMSFTNKDKNTGLMRQMKHLKETLFVVSSGEPVGDLNDFTDSCHLYPVCFQNLDNMISVAALNETGDRISDHSFRNSDFVDIAAPGENIVSTNAKGYYGIATGTSQATAFVTGAAALLNEKYKLMTGRWLKSRLVYTSDLDNERISKNVRGGTLNIARAIKDPTKTYLIKQGQNTELVGELDTIGRFMFVFRRGGDFEDESRKIYIELTELRRIWFDNKLQSWTVMVETCLDERCDYRGIKKFSDVLFQPEYGPPKNDTKEKISLITKDKSEIKIDLLNIKDLIVEISL